MSRRGPCIETSRAILQRDRVGLGLTVFVTVKIEPRRGHSDARTRMRRAVQH